jgi:tRNA 2-selenouridine synthase
MVKLVETVEQLVISKKQKTNDKVQPLVPENAVLLHCWRGGMRSAGVAWLLDLYGFKVFTLRGGYKSFRQWAHKGFDQPYNLKIVGGYTGSGKTGIIHQLQKAGKMVVDLEGLANHKGSAFGGINMPAQPSQEMIENLLALRLHETQNASKNPQPGDAPTIWMEDESQRIGDLMIPGALWTKMRSAPVFFIDIPFEQRLEYIVQDYGKGDKDKLVSATMRVQKKLGGLETKNAINYLLEGNVKESFRILLSYYDKAYLKGLNSRQNADNLVTTVSCQTVTNANAHALLNMAQLV